MKQGDRVLIPAKILVEGTADERLVLVRLFGALQITDTWIERSRLIPAQESEETDAAK